MEWSELYKEDIQPSDTEISAFIDNSLWEELNSFLTANYEVEPKRSYSGCSAQPGWNIKYQKAGKSLCTLYPMEGYFTALVVVGVRQEDEVLAILPDLSKYVQDLYDSTSFSAGGRWLMIDVTDEKILDDVKSLIQIRRKIKK